MKKSVWTAFVLFIFASLMAFLPSCKTTQITQEPIIVTQFSQKIVEDYSFSPEQILSLRFFNGPDTVSIVLKRRWYDQTSSIVDGKFNYSKTEHRDSVIINPFTEGRGLEYDSITHLLKITFGNDSSYLVFGPTSDKVDKEGNYILYSLSNTNPPKTYYGNSKYTITSGGQGKAELFFIFTNRSNPDYKGRIEPGAKAQQNYNQLPTPSEEQKQSVQQPDPNDY